MSRKTISLNGTWDVIFDENEKLKADCFKKRRKKPYMDETQPKETGY